MKRLLLPILTAVLTLPVAGAESAGTQIDQLLAEMTLEEKIGQLSLRGRGSRSSYNEIPAALVEAVRAGRVGGLINIMIPEEVDRLQRIAVEESPRHSVALRP